MKAGSLKEGEWHKYNILPRFAVGLGTIFNSNSSEVEIALSVHTNIHKDPKSNWKPQENFDGQMQAQHPNLYLLS